MNKINGEIKYSQIDRAFGWSLLAIGYLYWTLLGNSELGIGMGILTVIICSVTGIYLKLKGYKQNKRSIVCLGLIVLSAGVFLLFEGNLEKSLNFLAVHGLFIYWVALTTEKTIDKKLSGYMVLDIPHQLFIKGFSNWSAMPNMLKNRPKEKSRGLNILHGLLGILIIIPVLLVVIALLTNVDDEFQKMMANIDEFISFDIMKYVMRFLWGIPVAFYIGSVVWGNGQGKPAIKTKDEIDKSLNGVGIIPSVTVNVGLSALNGIYILFFISQGTYLFSAFNNDLPYGISYAEYARRGFFELCAVVVINLAVISLAYLMIKKPLGKTVKVEGAILSLSTMLLTVIAMSKMVLYIKHHGLTPLRVYASACMILLFVIFMIIFIRQFIKFNSGKGIIIAIIIAFFGTCYMNVDGQVAKYNIKEYLSGNIELMDEYFMNTLEDGAVPYFYKGYLDAKTTEDKMTLLRAIMYNDMGDETFQAFNLQKNKADKIRKQIREAIE